MPDGSMNGSGPHKTLGEKVAAGLFELVGELAANRRAQEVQEVRITGLARVLARGVPFAPEHAEQVAEVITQQGDLEHERGSKMYASAAEFRDLGRKEG